MTCCTAPPCQRQVFVMLVFSAQNLRAPHMYNKDLVLCYEKCLHPLFLVSDRSLNFLLRISSTVTQITMTPIKHSQGMLWGRSGMLWGCPQSVPRAPPGLALVMMCVGVVTSRGTRKILLNYLCRHNPFLGKQFMQLSPKSLYTCNSVRSAARL